MLIARAKRQLTLLAGIVLLPGSAVSGRADYVFSLNSLAITPNNGSNSDAAIARYMDGVLGGHLHRAAPLRYGSTRGLRDPEDETMFSRPADKVFAAKPDGASDQVSRRKFGPKLVYVSPAVLAVIDASQRPTLAVNCPSCIPQ
jgi:hypothetical protein